MNRIKMEKNSVSKLMGYSYKFLAPNACSKKRVVMNVSFQFKKSAKEQIKPRISIRK